MKISSCISRGLHICSELTCSNQYLMKFVSMINHNKGNLRLSLIKRNFTSNGLSHNTGLLKSDLHSSKKRHLKKKKMIEYEDYGFKISAFSTAEEYDLESLSEALPTATCYIPTKFGNDFISVTDVVHAVDKPDIDPNSQHLFFFREGAIVLWNIPDSEIKNILYFLKGFEENSFDNAVITEEREDMSYSYSLEKDKTTIVNDTVLFSEGGDLTMEKYAVSNAMALSVHLGTYEAKLDQFVDTIKPVTEDLRMGRKIKMSREEVLRKTGEMFALRHHINLNSDLLDTPDFYWDRADLENLYQATFNYFCVSKRTKVINERINHCIELVELLSSHLNDKHHVRLEWMIIVLIMVEVAFEVVHYIDKSFEKKQSNLA